MRSGPLASTTAVESGCADRVTFADLLALRVRAGRSFGQLPWAAAAQPGTHRAPIAGQGLEFGELRAYQAGDDPRHIHWRHTARRGRLLTKLYRVEHERPVWLLVDLGASMRFATRGVFKSVQAARAAAALGWQALAAGDRVGAAFFGLDQAHSGATGFRAARGERSWLALLRGLSRASEAAPAEGDAGDVSEGEAEFAKQAGFTMRSALDSVMAIAARGDSLIVVSDFLGADERLASRLAGAAARFGMSLLQVYDPIEREPPPPGAYPVVDGDRQRSIDLRDSASRAAWATAFDRRSRHWATLAARSGARYGLLATHEDPLRALAICGIGQPQAVSA